LIDAQTSAEEITPTFSATGEVSQDTEMCIDEEGRPVFTAAKDTDAVYRVETRKVPVPPHRFSPLKTSWSRIYPPLVEHLKLQVRMNIKSRSVELRTSKFTTDTGALQKGEDFVKAFTLGFDVDDAIALLRLDDLYIRSFEIRDVKASLHGEHLSRAIGRIAGKDGKLKHSIENATRTRIVLADQKIHLLGGYRNILVAQEAVVSLILGSPPVCRPLDRLGTNANPQQGKVYGNLRKVASRMKERF
jgi:RNA-binding protein PNO1